jgi:hypothetical protein
MNQQHVHDGAGRGRSEVITNIAISTGGDANLLLIWRERGDNQHSDTGGDANLLLIWRERGDNQHSDSIFYDV